MSASVHVDCDARSPLREKSEDEGGRYSRRGGRAPDGATRCHEQHRRCEAEGVRTDSANATPLSHAFLHDLSAGAPLVAVETAKDHA